MANMGIYGRKIAWTPADQQQLEELQARQARFNSERREPVMEFAKRMLNGVNTSAGHEFIGLYLIRCADEVRDLLAPFDSGVRPANPPEK